MYLTRKKKDDAQKEYNLFDPYRRGREMLRTMDSGVTSPKGTSVIVEASKGVPMPNSAKIGAIDEGMAETFRRAECLGYLKNKDYSYVQHKDYIACVFKGVKTPAGNWAIEVPAAQYTGHPDYDPDGDGRMYAGAILLAPNGWEVNGVRITNKGVFAIPDGDINIYLLGSQFETEHAVLAYKDYEKYLETISHIGANSGHPIMPPCAPPEGESAMRFSFAVPKHKAVEVTMPDAVDVQGRPLKGCAYIVE